MGGLVTGTRSTTIAALTSPFTAQNGTWTELFYRWLDANGNGLDWGSIGSYGGGWNCSWNEYQNGAIVGVNNCSLATTRPDGTLHIATLKAAATWGTEEQTFSATEQLPVGIGFRRGFTLRCPTSGADTNGFDWTGTTYLYGGNPAFRIMRWDQHNTSSTTLDATSSLEFALIAGLNQATANEWTNANTGYGTVGGTQTTPIPTTSTTGEPDYMFAIAGGSKTIGVVAVKRTAIADTNYAGVNFLSNTNTSRLKNYYQANAASAIPAGTTKTHRAIWAYRTSLTTSEATSIAADLFTPDNGFTVRDGSFTGYVDDEGLYAFASSTGNSVAFTHSISGPVTKRWLCIYKITGWSYPEVGRVTLGGAPLTVESDYTAYVDALNQVAYVKLMKGLVTSGAGAGERNNAQLAIIGPSSQARPGGLGGGWRR